MLNPIWVVCFSLLVFDYIFLISYLFLHSAPILFCLNRLVFRFFLILLDHVEPEVNFQSIGIISDEFREVKTRLPIDESERDHVLFTLKEGSRYRLKLTFCVLHNIVSGLTYSNTVWKGVQGLFSILLSYFIQTLLMH